MIVRTSAINNVGYTIRVEGSVAVVEVSPVVQQIKGTLVPVLDWPHR